MRDLANIIYNFVAFVFPFHITLHSYLFYKTQKINLARNRDLMFISQAFCYVLFWFVILLLPIEYKNACVCLCVIVRTICCCGYGCKKDTSANNLGIRQDLGHFYFFALFVLILVSVGMNPQRSFVGRECE